MNFGNRTKGPNVVEDEDKPMGWDEENEWAD